MGRGGNSPFVSVCQCRDYRNDRDYDEEENDETCIDDEGQTDQPPRPCNYACQFEDEEHHKENDAQTARTTADLNFLVVFHLFLFPFFFLI